MDRGHQATSLPGSVLRSASEASCDCVGEGGTLIARVVLFAGSFRQGVVGSGSGGEESFGALSDSSEVVDAGLPGFTMVTDPSLSIGSPIKASSWSILEF